MTIKRINLWSGPRNISTALMYSFAQRSDCQVFDEPLYAHFLMNSNASEYHPGTKEVLDSMEKNGENVIQNLMEFNERPLAFFKNMAHHFIQLDSNFIGKCTNLFLIRHPKDVITSISKVLDNPTLADIGLEKQVQILDYLNSQNLSPIIIDSNNFLHHPKENMKILCEALEIEFEASMLSWNAGPIPEDGIWAKYWYKSVHRSTGFGKFSKSPTDFPARFNELLKEATPLYEQLKVLELSLFK